MAEPLRRTLISVAPLFAGIMLLVVGHGLQTTYLPLRAAAEGIASRDVGFVMSAYYIGFVAGCVFVPRVVQRVGHVRTFASFAALAAAIALAHGLYVDPVAWGLLRGFTGFCLAGLFMVSESWLNERTSDEHRGRMNSFYRMVDLAALTGGHALIAVAPALGFEAFIYVSIAISLALVPITLSAGSAPAPIAAARLPLGALYRASPVGVVGCLAIGLGNGAFWSLGPLFAAGEGRGEGFIAAFMSLAVVGGAIAAYPVGIVSDRIDRRQAIAAMMFATTLMGVLLVFAELHFSDALLPLIALYGVAMLPLYALCVAHTNDRLAAGQFVYASRGLLLVFGAGAALGPSIAAALIEWLGAPALFGYTATIYGVAGLFTLYRIFRRDAVSPAEPVGFAAVVGTSPSVFSAEPAPPPPVSPLGDEETVIIDQEPEPAPAKAPP
jgi:MFS family permease